MNIKVKMSSDEFLEFMKWRNDIQSIKNQVRSIAMDMEKLAEKVFEAMEECDGTDGPEFKIKNQYAALLLADMAKEFIA